jgi:hypothetical protein
MVRTKPLSPMAAGESKKIRLMSWRMLHVSLREGAADEVSPGFPVGMLFRPSSAIMCRKSTPTGRVAMTKEMKIKKEAKKKPAKSMKEKRAEKKAKKSGKV